jgi:DNA-binding PadR family transcriptional regulator
VLILTLQLYLYRLIDVQRDRRPSEQTLIVLRTLLDDPREWRHGYDLCQQTGLKAGSMYPILIRLADRGWLETRWEDAVPAGRPPRHLYRLTTAGLEWAKKLQPDRSSRRKKARLRPQLEASS